MTAHQAERDKPLNESDFSRYRAHAARGNDLAADRPDVLYVCKEICRFMSAPAELAQRLFLLMIMMVMIMMNCLRLLLVMLLNIIILIVIIMCYDRLL